MRSNPGDSATLVELLRRRAELTPGRPVYTFLADGEVPAARLTFRELDAQARSIAAWLEREAAPGDRALLLYGPGLEFIAAFFGCLYAGVVPAPLAMAKPRSGGERLLAIQDDMQAKLALTTQALLPEFEGSLAGVRWQATDEIGADLARGWREPDLSGNSLAYLQYTSGSTDVPRGVMVSHANLLHNMAYIDDAFEHSPESISVTWLPHFHDMGLIYGLLQPVHGGFHCIVMPPASFTQRPARWLEAISRYQGTHSGGPNFAYDLCVKQTTPEQRAALDLRAWGIAFNGAEAVHRETLDQFAEAFAPCGFRRGAFYPAYGLAEATLKVSGGHKGGGAVFLAVEAASLQRNRVALAAPDDAEARVMVGCGKAGRGTTIRIVNPETFAVCAPDELGEIWIQNPSVAQGYWQRTEETERTFRARLDTGEGPFLRSGDLGFLHQGELYIAGRVKDLIIIRGQNHHPSDIERTAGGAHPELRVGAAAAFSIDEDGQERLVIVQEAETREPETAAIAAAVRQAVAEQHELQLYSLVLVRKGTIPKTSSGKIQRRLCRTRYLTGELEVVGVSVLEGAAPQAQVPALNRAELLAAAEAARLALLESYLRGQVARALGVDAAQIDVSRPVTAFGLDSLAAMEIKNRVEADLGVPVPAVELLKGITVQGLGGLILAGLGAAISSIAPLAGGGPPAISFEQERLWLLDQLSPGNGAYHIPFAFRLRGPLDTEKLERAVGEIARRHEALRTSFPARGGKPVPVVAPPGPFRLEVTSAANEEEARRLAEEEARRPFDLGRGPLFRFRLFRLGAEDHVALLTLHHIVSDVWSVNLFVEELAALYGGVAPPELPLQFADFIRWQREHLQTAPHVEFWKAKLAGAAVLELPTDRQRPAKPSFRGATLSFEVPATLSAALRQFARAGNNTPFTVLLAGFEALLRRYTDQSDIVIGLPSANRGRSEVEKLIGFFATPLVVRTSLDGDPAFGEALARVRAAVLEAYSHQELPFAQVVEAAHPGRRAGYTPLFRIMFGMVRSPLAGATLPGLELSAWDVDAGMTDFDLVLNLVEEPAGWRGLLTYSADLFRPETIQALVDSYPRILEAGVEAPQTPLSRMPLAPGAERPTVAITATFTAEPVAETLSFWFQELGLPFRVRFAPYNQVFQQLLDPASLVSANQNGVNLVLVRLEDWRRFGGGTSDAENLRNFVAAVKSAAARSAAPFVVCACPASPGSSDPESERRLAAELEGQTSIHFIPAAQIGSLYPAQEVYDPRADELGHIPYTPVFYAALASMLARRIHALRRPPHKVIVLDCDQTLWQGVCGEDGPAGVVIDEPRRWLQEFMVAQQQAGMLLCLCTKNNEEDVLAVFDARADMPLARRHLVAWRINWAPKSENLRSLADELGVGLDSFIFVDDNPAECAEVEANCPEVLTLELPRDPDGIPRFLQHVWAFDHWRVTDEDRARTALYGQRLERARLQKHAVSMEEFLAGLKLEIRIAPMRPEQLPRVAQLTQRTNQMNCSTVRRTEAQVQELPRDGTECLAVEVADRFGDYGLVGVVLCGTAENALRADTFLLSCRALGRGVEHRMLAELGRLAQEHGLAFVEVPFVPTAKNRPALDFLSGVGARFRHEGGFRFPAEIAAGAVYKPAAQPAPAAPASAAPATAGSADLARIAVELCDAGRILAASRSVSNGSPRRVAAGVPPRTAVEKQMAALWGEMLKVSTVGIHDNFFDLGGHSLLAVQLLSRIRETFHLELSLNAVFAGAFTVAELARQIETRQIEQEGGGAIQSLLDEIEELSDEEARALLEREENR